MTMVALDMRLFTRQEVLNTDAELKELMAVILRIMKENTHTFMPWIYSSSEGTACYCCSSFRCIFQKCSSATEADFTIYMKE